MPPSESSFVQSIKTFLAKLVGKSGDNIFSGNVSDGSQNDSPKSVGKTIDNESASQLNETILPPQHYTQNDKVTQTKGVFTSYHIEYLHDLIGEDRIKMKLKETEDEATMGTPFKEFVTREIRYGGKGVVWVLGVLAGYFRDDPEVIKIIYESSKKYAGQWVDLHFLYSDIIKTLSSSRRKNFSLDIEGAYKFSKGSLHNEALSLVIRKRRAPRSGYYLLYKSTNDSWGTSWNLESNGSENGFIVSMPAADFEISIATDIAIIKKIEVHSNFRKVDIEGYNKIVEDMIFFYTDNFAEISTSMKKEMEGTKVSNAFISAVSSYFSHQPQKWLHLEKMNNRHWSVWRKIE